jgi:putative ABC transport system substrate-binding protein
MGLHARPPIWGRRAFLAVAAGALLSRPAPAQQPGIPARIGWVSTEPQPDPFLDGFREGLRRHGYVEGQHVALELRHVSGNLPTLQAAVSELIESKVAFIVSSGPAIRAVRMARDVPVLFAISGDPVELGIASSLARPGGNFTGITFMSREVAGKRVELLKRAVPGLQTLAALSNVDHPGEASERRATEDAAASLGMRVAYAPFNGAGELDAGLARVRAARAEGMIAFPDGATMVNRARLAQFAVAERLPSMFGWSEFADAGGLMSYGANQRETYLRLAAYADRLLRGAKPGELPIEQATRFELVLNSKTARTLGLSFPQSVMVSADRLVE